MSKKQRLRKIASFFGIDYQGYDKLAIVAGIIGLTFAAVFCLMQVIPPAGGRGQDPLSTPFDSGSSGGRDPLRTKAPVATPTPQPTPEPTREPLIRITRPVAIGLRSAYAIMMLVCVVYVGIALYEWLEPFASRSK